MSNWVVYPTNQPIETGLDQIPFIDQGSLQKFNFGFHGVVKTKLENISIYTYISTTKVKISNLKTNKIIIISI